MQGKFLTVNINECLSLNDKHFGDPNLNIDHLSKSLPELEPKQQLVIATKCVNLCEKFHSYFHFEQSYFHLLLGKQQNSSEEYEAAIFQDPLNDEAKHLLNSNLTDKLYTRDFQSFSEFLKFAVGNNILNTEYLQGSYWYWYDKYCETNDLNFLIKTVETISSAHQLYHTNAAKIYYNRHLCFKSLGNEILAKNDLVKARNLDKSIYI
jgi:tetratricopeptide (TPR) repeat protein